MSSEDCLSSSTFREIRAINLALNAYGPILKNKAVKWFSDSQNCVRIVLAGSTKADLQQESLDIFHLCLKWNINLDIQWVPREMNTIADNISKIRDTDDWEVTSEFFMFMSDIWGPYDVDRFATLENRKTVRFNSRFFDSECEAVDAFTQNWANSNNWLVPPIYLVNKTIMHIVECGGKGTLIVPKWPSAAFWPLLFEKDFRKKAFIRDVLEFNCGQNIFIQGRSKKCIFGSDKFKSRVIAIQF